MKKLILAVLWIITAGSASAQVPANTKSIGWGVKAYNHKFVEDGRIFNDLGSDKAFQYFYKENRALEIGLLYGHNFSTFPNSSILGHTATQKSNRYSFGGYIGKRNLYPIDERFYLFTGYGAGYHRKINNYSSRFAPETNMADQFYRTQSHAVFGYGNLGLLYFINQRFSLETNLIETQLTYERPINDLSWEEYKIDTWQFHLNGIMDRIAVTLRYYF